MAMNRAEHFILTSATGLKKDEDEDEEEAKTRNPLRKNTRRDLTPESESSEENKAVWQLTITSLKS
ncbi:hypothetical protein CVT26_007206 [Gymnopilus dilepis]|uniref:Uncharacterized protein n=1 Tax=Gymnopilus dilepis TaxID=231916 RepID=A0A409W0A3_9AGAR|nr:hypothetical protein CVT26_007206 [Gymnopilus dilepis]